MKEALPCQTTCLPQSAALIHPELLPVSCHSFAYYVRRHSHRLDRLRRSGAGMRHSQGLLVDLHVTDGQEIVQTDSRYRLGDSEEREASVNKDRLLAQDAGCWHEAQLGLDRRPTFFMSHTVWNKNEIATIRVNSRICLLLYMVTTSCSSGSAWHACPAGHVVQQYCNRLLVQAHQVIGVAISCGDERNLLKIRKISHIVLVNQFTQVQKFTESR